VLKLLGDGGLKIMTKLINTVYETGEWPKEFTEVTIALTLCPPLTLQSAWDLNVACQSKRSKALLSSSS
jgi:hypothetical protein